MPPTDRLPSAVQGERLLPESAGQRSAAPLVAPSERPAWLDPTVLEKLREQLEKYQASRIENADMQAPPADLRASFKNILQQARRDAQQDTNRESERTPTQKMVDGLPFQPALGRTLTEIARNLANDPEAVANLANSWKPADNRVTPAQRELPALQPLRDWMGAASEWVREVDADFSAGTATGATPWRSPGAELSALAPLLIALAAAGAVGAGWFVFRQSQRTRRLMNISPVEIASSDDLIAQYHAFARQAPVEAADWWTHHRAAVAYTARAPEHSESMSALAAYYEQARYSPQGLSPEELARARRLLQQCAAV